MQLTHYPRLDTILMVEDTIKQLNFYPTRKELWKSLPRQVQYQTFKVIIEYLLDSKKILIDKKKIIWILNSNLVEKSIKIEL